MKMDWDELELERKKAIRSQFADFEANKRKFGEKKNTSKKRLQMQGSAGAKAKNSNEKVQMKQSFLPISTMACQRSSRASAS